MGRLTVVQIAQLAVWWREWCASQNDQIAVIECVGKLALIADGIADGVKPSEMPLDEFATWIADAIPKIVEANADIGRGANGLAQAINSVAGAANGER